MNRYPGEVRNEFKKRLAGDWVDLSNILDIPDHVRNTWKSGFEAEGIWVFLDARQQLNRLPKALDKIDRPDLAKLFRSSDEQSDNDAVAAILKLLEIDSTKQFDSTQLHELTTLVQGKKKSELDELARKVRAQLSAVLSEPLGQDQSKAQVSQLYQELPKYSGLEAAIVGVAFDGGDFSGKSFVKNYEDASRRICIVGNDTKFVGTGFLVALNRVMTNFHVWETAIALTGQLYAYFDHDGTRPIDSLPKFGIKREPVTLSPVQKLDYAILELTQPVDTMRGFFPLSNHNLRDREALHVIGYPGKQVENAETVPTALTMRSGILFDSNSQTKRIAYSAETAPGSSGSPVFRENFELIGLHHHGETGFNNHGIPMWAIINDLGPSQQLVTVASSQTNSSKTAKLESSEVFPEPVAAASTANLNGEAEDKKKFEQKVKALHQEVEILLKKLTNEALRIVCETFELEADQQSSLAHLRKQILTDSSLTDVVNLLSTPYAECSMADQKYIAEILRHLIPLRYDKNLFDRLRNKFADKAPLFWMSEVANKPIAEVIMAGVDGMPVRLKDELGHGGFSLNKNPETGAPLGSEPTEDEVAAYMADLYAAIGERLSASLVPHTPRETKQLADKLDSRIRTLAKRHKRTVYCVVELPRDDDERQHEMAIIEQVARYVPNLAMIEYNTLKDDPSEEDFMNAFHWVMKIGN